MIGIDPFYFIMMAPVFLLSAYCSYKVKSTFNKYSKVHTRSGLTGAETARRILQQNGLSDIDVVETDGFLSDHYDPTKRVIRLSPDVFRGATVAAIGVAAHEAGHAIQHKEGYQPLKLRNMTAPAASIGSNMSWIIMIVGFLMGAMGLVKIGIALFSLVVFFQLITLPVEFNASSRAKRILAGWGTVLQSERDGVSAVLSSAAMTYVAAATSAVMTLLYYLLRAGFLGGRDE